MPKTKSHGATQARGGCHLYSGGHQPAARRAGRRRTASGRGRLFRKILKSGTSRLADPALWRGARSVLVLPPPGSPSPSPAQAWSSPTARRARRDVMHVEPAFVLPAVGPYRAPARRAAQPVARPRTCRAATITTALKLCHVFEAWNIPTANGPQGKGLDRRASGHRLSGGHPELIRSTSSASGY